MLFINFLIYNNIVLHTGTHVYRGEKRMQRANPGSSINYTTTGIHPILIQLLPKIQRMAAGLDDRGLGRRLLDDLQYGTEVLLVIQGLDVLLLAVADSPDGPEKHLGEPGLLKIVGHPLLADVMPLLESLL